MPENFTPDQQKRLAAFDTTPADLALLRAEVSALEGHMPRLLADLHGSFSGWPRSRRH
ncbi:hypothetical protein [Paracraurococcus lichenis]|uniref:Uncharacterized protein n=1 Tax=Paracraurococcus lichenis TaxID=3064888 RepID=A0ABT9ECT5_9PROT|nr:hypothetical protein [Paracraurococcus sp. LOR1-02]MDO9713700.1 hypothetical protein [Paracraurococcus sp. LOR1-02]